MTPIILMSMGQHRILEFWWWKLRHFSLPTYFRLKKILKLRTYFAWNLTRTKIFLLPTRKVQFFPYFLRFSSSLKIKKNVSQSVKLSIPCELTDVEFEWKWNHFSQGNVDFDFDWLNIIALFRVNLALTNLFFIFYFRIIWRIALLIFFRKLNLRTNSMQFFCRIFDLLNQEFSRDQIITL